MDSVSEKYKSCERVEHTVRHMGGKGRRKERHTQMLRTREDKERRENTGGKGAGDDG